jgi:hypothetical protein
MKHLVLALALAGLAGAASGALAQSSPPELPKLDSGQQA